jgi:lysophospholipase L1-like esterase
MLGENYEVFQPEDNCRFAKYTLRMLFDFKDILKDCEVIHWNNGLWDVCDIFEDGVLFSTDEEYVENILRIARILKSFTPNVIFATTTPVHPTYTYNHNEDIQRFNALVVPRLKEIGIQINDLYPVVAADFDNLLCEDKIHLSQKGIQLCADKVVAAIKSFE